MKEGEKIKKFHVIPKMKGLVCLYYKNRATYVCTYTLDGALRIPNPLMKPLILLKKVAKQNVKYRRNANLANGDAIQSHYAG